MNRLLPVFSLFACLFTAYAQVPTAAEAVPERAVYIPYERLWEVFEKKGRGVFLPYEDYERLRKAARERQEKPVREPVASLVAEVSGTVSIVGTVANVEASLRVEVLAKGWQRVPLGLRNVAVSKATVGNAPARLVYDAKSGYALLVNNESGKPQTVVVDMTFAKACVKAPGRNSVSFEPPPAPVGRWQIRIPEPGVKVDVKPVVAATEAIAGDGKSTVMNAFVGATPAVHIAWTPKAEGARGLQALVSVASEVTARLDEGITRAKARLTSTVTRAEINGQVLLVPTAYRVVNVFDENVRAWSVKKAGEVQEISVEFFKPVQGRQVLLVELERLANEATVAVPAVAVRGASREQGTLAVGVAEGLRGEVVRRERLTQQDLEELTKSNTLAKGGQWQFGYRFAAVPYELSLRLAKIEPRVLATSLTEVQITPELLRLDFTTAFDVQRAGLFRVDVAVPEGFTVEEVTGVAGKNLAAAGVDGFHPGDPKDGMVPVAVNLSRRALGRTGLRLRLVRKLSESGLLHPGEKPAEFELAMPRLEGKSIERETGGLVVYAPGSLRVTPGEAPGLRPVAHALASGGVPTVQPSGLMPTLSYLYAEKTARLQLTARRRPPYVTVRQLLRPTFGSGSVRYALTLYLDVQYSGIDRLRLDLPADLVKVRPSSLGVRLVPFRDAPPADLAEGYAAWHLEPETEFVGARQVTLTWTTPTEALDVGKSVSVPVPRIVVQGADRTFGQILLNKDQGIDVLPVTSDGLRPIDPRHDLMAGVQPDGATRAFEFHGDWQLTVKASRYEAEEVKVTSIERGLVRMVLTRGNVTSVQALYRLSTVRQRLVVALPDGVALDTHHLRLNGRSATLERGEGGTRLVPLQGLPQGKPFLMELRYTVPGGGELVPPSFPEEPAVQKVYLSVHVPGELAYLGHRGDWHSESRWWMPSGSSLRPRSRRSSSELVDEICAGLGVDRTQLMNFATDGFHLLYSTLRPRSGEAGSLRISLARSWHVQGLLVVLILGVGIALVRSSLTRKLGGAMAVLVGWILLAMVLPSFAWSMLSNAAVGAVLVVGAVWFLWCLVALRPRFRFVTLAGEMVEPPLAEPPLEKPADQETAGGPAEALDDGESRSAEKEDEGGSSDA